MLKRLHQSLKLSASVQFVSVLVDPVIPTIMFVREGSPYRAVFYTPLLLYLIYIYTNTSSISFTHIYTYSQFYTYPYTYLTRNLHHTLNPRPSLLYKTHSTPSKTTRDSDISTHRGDSRPPQDFCRIRQAIQGSASHTPRSSSRHSTVHAMYMDHEVPLVSTIARCFLTNKTVDPSAAT
ncbi:uncharacterized protein BP01DRAFT_366600 [Aspergillus saccharolyticus JOP 1030-1]|uniref:Uncharacterized protein n=1 Tax=Aspergillus saccharolyticus JOP 1030-1 TaxID=1450539 RepID=A0A318ZDV9_9EURO|nr:hypothetical protein BP01DRAFT_366600 [Aspergillus saccharolyticus JOP 1030-1]PYH44474.1 hypothetical protein BP01DRAFT_366600 [Aspergillus saccharolyticus JOP 1030-1]